TEMHAGVIVLSLLAIGQDQNDEQKLLAQVHNEARTFAKAFKDDDHAKLVDLSFAPWLEQLGTRSRAVLAWRQQTAAYRCQGLQFESYDVEPPVNFVKAGKDWLCLVPAKMKFQALEGTAHRNSYFLALSRDQGKSWRFLDVADAKATEKLADWLPELPKSWGL